MNLTDLTRLAVRYCERLGVDEAEAFVQRKETVEVVLERAEIQNERVKVESGVGVRVIKDKKLGFAFTSVLSERSVKNACECARSLANVSPPNPDWVSLPTPLKLPEVPAGIFDVRVASMDCNDVLALTLQAYDEAKGYDKRVDVDDGKFSTVKDEVAISNSHGVEAEGRTTLIYGYLVCIAKENGEASSMAYEYDITRSLREFSPNRIGRAAAEKALLSLKPKAVESFTGKVLFDSDPAAFLLQAIIFSVNADNVQRGRSLWAGRLGDEVASQRLSVVDDGLLPNGIGSSSFDLEGVPRQRTPIITRGKLEGFLHNSFTANKEGRKSTGNAYRDGYYAVPVIGASNFMIEAGRKSLNEMISEVDKGIIVRRFSGNVRPDSGEFSGIAKQASYVEGGEIKYSLKETMVSGNVFQAIKNVIDVGSETRPTFLNAYVPPMLIDEVNVVSKR